MEEPMKDDLVESLLVHDVDEALPPDHERRIREGLGPLLALPTDPTKDPTRGPPPPAPPAPLADVAAPLLGKLPVIGLLVLGAAGAGFVAGRATAPVPGSAITTTAPVATLSAPSPIVTTPSIACASPAASAAPSATPIATPSPATTAAVPPQPTASSGSDPFDREQSLLERARTALVRHDATAAEQALDECEKEFAKPRHAEERDYLRIQTLRERGDNARARERARAFLVNYPTSLLRGRVQALLVE
jgi:hypothetical protein